MLQLLDVAVGPIILIYGLGLLLVLGILIIIIFFAVRAIKSIHQEVEEDVHVSE